MAFRNRLSYAKTVCWTIRVESKCVIFYATASLANVDREADGSVAAHSVRIPILRFTIGF